MLFPWERLIFSDYTSGAEPFTWQRYVSDIPIIWQRTSSRATPIRSSADAAARTAARVVPSTRNESEFFILASP